MNSLQVYATKTFNGCVLDCYVAPDQQDKGDFWATRAQIGTLLEYEEPMKAVAKIHERNKERLDKFSTVVKLTMVEGEREVSREVTVYSFKGLLEVCRYSNQPKANAVMDWLFDVADEIRRIGSYTLHSKEEAETQRNAVNVERAKILQHMLDAPAAPLSEESRAVIQHEVFKIITGGQCVSMLPAVTEKYYTATEIGEMFGVSSKKIGRVAKSNGLKSEEGSPSQYGQWRLSKSPYSAHQCSTFVYNGQAVEWFREHSVLLGRGRRA